MKLRIFCSTIFSFSKKLLKCHFCHLSCSDIFFKYPFYEIQKLFSRFRAPVEGAELPPPLLLALP